MAFCWNFTAIAFGGIAPIISMWLIEHVGVDSVAYYLMSVCTITIAVTTYLLLKIEFAPRSLSLPIDGFQSKRK